MNGKMHSSKLKNEVNNVNVEDEGQEEQAIEENPEEHEIFEENQINEEKMEDVLERLGLSKFKEVFAKEEIDLEAFKASSALELKTILNIPFGKIKMLKIEIEKIVEPEATKSGFLCPFCGKSFVSADILQEHIAQQHGGGFSGQIEVTLNEEVGNEEVNNEESSNEGQDVSIFQDIGEEQDLEAVTLEEECDISMKSVRSDVSMNEANEVDLTDVSMNGTSVSDDDDAEELENKEKVEKLKNVANKLLYSDDESEQLNLAEEMRSMIVTAEQIKTSGAGFILKTMRTFANGKLGDLIRKLYRRYKRALVQLDMSEGDEEEEEKEEDSNEEVNAEKTVESEDNASFGDGIEDEMCTEEEWRNAEEDLNTEEGGKEDLNTEEGGKETEDNSSFFVKRYICDVCNKDCKRSDNLKRHRKNTHEKEKSQSLNKYACDTCHQDCKRSDNLKRHMLRMHGTKQDNVENQCPGCKKGFANKQNCQKHMKNCKQVSSAV